MKIIKGSTSPKAEEKTFYELSDFSSPIFNNKPTEKYIWTLFKQDKATSWKQVSNNIKYGEKASYTFGEKVVGIPYRIEVHTETKNLLNVTEKKFVANLVVTPRTAKEPVIGRVILLNRESSDVNKAKFSESLSAEARTSNLFGKEITFYLWEEGASESDKYKKPKKAFVDKNGIAKVTFSLSEYATPKTLMDFFTRDKNTTKKFFVSAVYENKMGINKTPVVASDGTAQPASPPANNGNSGSSGIISRLTEIVAEGIGSNISSTTENTRTATSVGQTQSSNNSTNCGEKYCIKKGDKSELIREINIRLAGFGGNVPTDEFTDKTEKMIKQFQRDYMKVTETGKVCGNVLRAIDEFSKNFDISSTLWGELKCSCSTKGKQATSKLRGIKETNNCKGFGDKTGADTSPEASNKYEYPGIHRSLLFGFKALQFYFSKQKTYKIDSFSSGYRCRFKNYKTTNHQGKALDIQFSKGNWAIRGPQKKNLIELRTMRDDIFVKYLGAQKEWPNPNLFSIEPIDLLYYKDGSLRYDHTFSWIHMDVRQYEKKYLENKYFCTNSSSLNGKSIVQLAIELGFSNTCSCNESYQRQQTPKVINNGTCSCNNDLKKEELKSIAVHASKANIDKYFDGFNETFEKFNINSCLQKIHFLAQVIQESGSFRYNVEQGDAAYLAPYGGWHGRGLIQLTTKPNYIAFEAAIGEDVTSSAAARDKVTKSPYAVHSAGWFWDKRAKLNGLSNENDFIYITYRVNGGFNHIDDRLDNVKKGFDTLYSKCTNNQGKTTDYKYADSKAYNDKKAAFAWGLWHDPGFTKKGCTKNKDLAIEGYQRFVDLTTESDSTTNYYGIHKLSYFSDLVYTKVVEKKTEKYVNVRKAALKRLKDLKK